MRSSTVADLWLSAYQDHGREGLEAVPAQGRPTKLTVGERELLRRLLLKGATAYGFPTDLCAGPRVIELIRRRFAVTYHANHISRLLRSLGFSPQRPERRARERNEKAIRGWLKDRWPRVKKKRQAAERHPRLPQRERSPDVAAGAPGAGLPSARPPSSTSVVDPTSASP